MKQAVWSPPCAQSAFESSNEFDDAFTTSTRKAEWSLVAEHGIICPTSWARYAWRVDQSHRIFA